ncbi:caspase-1-like isoform X2 [Genypterus blacodes]|uniref:caspase-1-like isoform X2 n=1 Tax=Genypterus blacodes TaxID=154954 RepID=UPI003F76FB23
MAADELRRVRKGFVENVTVPQIRQLLDDLRTQEVLNEEEKDSVLEENPSRADKARTLIDMVLKKGNVGCTKMINILKKEHPQTCLALGLNAPPVVQRDLAPNPGAEDIYPLNEEAPRLALIITNKTFKNARLNRSGAEKDEANMEALLRSQRYEVVTHKDLTGKQIEKAVSEFSKDQRLKQADSAFVVIMSHGKMGAVLGVNWTEEEPDEFLIDNIFKYLSTESCPALLNKPKIIIIQACRGAKSGAVIVSDNIASDSAGGAEAQPAPHAVEECLEEDTLHFAHQEKDFVYLLSSTPDTVSYRDTRQGSLLIQYIDQVFQASSRVDDIEELFRKVMRCFESKLTNKKQMPTKDRCTLTRRFYLFPRH